MFSGRLIQLTAGACLSIALVTALPAFLLWLDFSSFEKDQVRSLLAPRQTLITVLLGCAALLPVLFFGTYFYRHLRTMRKLNVQMREAVEGRTEELELDEEVPPEARDLANTASEMLQRSMQRQDELNSNLASATSISSRDRTRFTAMIGELAQGVMVCDVNGNLLLFNSRARPSCATASTAAMCTRVPCSTPAHTKAPWCVCKWRLWSRAANTRQARPRPSPDSSSRSTTSRCNTRSARTGLDSLGRTVESRQHSGLIKALGRDVRRHCEHLERLSFQQSDLLEQTWPLEPILASDLLTAINQRLGREHNTELPLSAVLPAETWVRADGFAMVQGLSAVVQTLARDWEAHVTSLSARADQGLLIVSLHWGDGTLRQEDFRALAMTSARRGNEASSTSMLELLQRHSGRAWLEESRTGQNLRLALPLCEPPVLGSAGSDRGEYDFGERIESGSIRVPEPPLAKQVCTAVGMLSLPSPSGEKTDGQISLAAIRLVNGTIQSTARTEFETQWLNSPANEAEGPDPLALARFSEGTVVALHDAERTLSKLGHAQRDVLEAANIVDTASMARLAMPMADGFSLYLIAEQLGVEPRVDSAESIARTTGKIYLRLAKALENRGIRSYSQLIHAVRQLEEQSNASNPYL